MKPQSWGVLVLAHGTVGDLSELPEFLRRIRRGRPASVELIAELRRRYEAIGGSPLLELTRAQARALGAALGVPAAAAMRLSAPEVNEVLPELVQCGVERVCLVPLAPFSVGIYVDAAKEAGRGILPAADLVSVPPWGDEPEFVASQVALVSRHLSGAPGEHVVLTAHSLPSRAIAMGDRYAAEFERSARAIGERLHAPFSVAYQSQGADGGNWLGPELLQVMKDVKEQGARRVLVAPVGFVAEHIETLYDLDIDARAQAAALELEFVRVPAVGSDPAFIDALAGLTRRTMEAAA